MPHRKLTLQEVAEHLHLSVEDVRILVKQREIPHELSGPRLSFSRQDIETWASQRLLGFSGGNLVEYHKKTTAKMHDLSRDSSILAELLKPSFIVPAMQSRTKASVIRDMVELADSTGLLNDKSLLLSSIQEREKMCSTALAGGLAILHAQYHEPYLSEDSFVVMGKTIQPLPFGSPDGRTTDMYFLVCCQDDRIHLHVLARICMLCYHTPLLMKIRDADSAALMYEIIVQSESELIKTMK